MTSKQVTYADEASHIGDNIFNQSKMTSIEKAISKIVDEYSMDRKIVDVIEDLLWYISDHPARKIIGLAKKLELGERQDIIQEAELQKNRFERRLAKNQMSVVEQKVYVQILAGICTIWEQKIKPRIVTGETNDIIDQIIYDELLQPIHEAMILHDSSMTMDTVRGMLYYLTGKCHVVWNQ